MFCSITKPAFLKNIECFFVTLIIFALNTLIVYILFCSTFSRKTIPVNYSDFYKQQIYEIKNQKVIYNKKICDNDFKTQTFVNLTNNNYFADFYNKVISEEKKSRLDSFDDQLDTASILLPRYSKNVILNNITNSIFFYSAFYQSAENHELTITSIAISDIYCPNKTSKNVNKVPQLMCVFESHHSGELRVKASIDCLPEGHDFYFTSVLIRCSVPARVQNHRHLSQIKLIQRNLTTHQSVVSKTIDIIKSETKQFSSQNTSSMKNDITVCVRPLFDSINVLNLLEFIAYYQSNGITNVVLYYYDFANLTKNSLIAVRANHFIRFIASVPGVKLHPFVLPKTIEHSIHSGAQMVTIHDCLMRYPNSVQIHVDIDEFVFIEKKKLSIRQWIEDQMKSLPKFVALSIASVLHCHEFNFINSTYYEFAYLQCKRLNTFANFHQCKRNSNKINQFYQTLNNETVKQALIIPNNINSQQTLWPHEIRSKVIILQPKLVQHMGIHNVWKYSSSDILSYNIFTKSQQSLFKMIRLLFNNQTQQQFYGLKNVNSKEVALHHYRWCCDIEQPYFFNILNFYSINDNIVHKDFKNLNMNSQIEQLVIKNFKNFLKMNTTNNKFFKHINTFN